MPTIRQANPEDDGFLKEMLTVAADWRPLRSRDHGRAGTGSLRGRLARRGGVGFVAEDERPVGAAWWRFFPQHDPGYGFVDDRTPEVSIGLVADARRQGIGTALLEALIEEALIEEALIEEALIEEALIEEALSRAVPALSLSVEPDNPAMVLYQRLGFVTVVRHDGPETRRLTALRRCTGTPDR